MSKLRLIVNPVSGTCDKQRIVDKARKRIAAAGFAVEVTPTTCRGDATHLAQEGIAEGCDTIIAIGGDGTVNEVARALCGSEVALGIIPCGSGNGLARHLKIPMNVDGAIDTIIQHNVVDCDHCTINDIPFFCTFGVGLDAVVSNRFSHLSHRGFFSYIKSAITEYKHYAPETYEIKINGETITETALIIAGGNASQYGNNAYIAPDADMSDGLIDLTIIHHGSFLSEASLAVELFTKRLNKNHLVTTIRSSEFEIIRPSEGPAHIDGEPLILPAHLRIECHHSTLKILAPLTK